MKVLKRIGIGILVLLVILLIISLFLPSKIHVERSTVINAPAKRVYNTVNNLRTWINWSYWDQIDPNMKSTFEGPEAGVGATHRWESTNEKVGHGSMTITESMEPSKIATSLQFGEYVSPGGWSFDETPEGVKSTIFMDMELPFYTRIPGLFFDGMLGKDFDKTLANLKKYTEAMPAESESTWVVDSVTTTAAMVMSVKVATTMKELTSKLGESYEQIMTAMNKQGVKQTGPAYAVYHKWSKEGVEVEPGIVVDKMAKTDGIVVASERPGTKAIKIDYMGDYNNLDKAYNFLEGWMKENKTQASGAPWEEYITDPKTETDTAKWHTQIYFPVL